MLVILILFVPGFIELFLCLYFLLEFEDMEASVEVEVHLMYRGLAMDDVEPVVLQEGTEVLLHDCPEWSIEGGEDQPFLDG